MRFLILLLFAIPASAQYTYIIQADSTKLRKSGGNNELIIENGTRATTGVLVNYGNGRTRFSKPRVSGDTLFVGVDTILLGFTPVTPTWQQTLTAGPNLTGANLINGGGFSLGMEEVVFSISNLGANRPITFSTGRFTGSLNPSNNLSITSDSTVFDQFCTGGSCAAINEGYYVFRNLAPFGDTTSYKPVVINGDGRIFRSTYWPATPTPTLQQVTDAGNTTSNNIVVGDLSSNLSAADTRWDITAGGAETNIDVRVKSKGLGGSSLSSGNEKTTISAINGNLAAVSGNSGDTEIMGFDLDHSNFYVYDEINPDDPLTATSAARTGDSTFKVNGSLYTTTGVRFSGLPIGPGTKAVRINANGTLSIADTTASSGGSPAGNYGNVQLNRNGAFATAASDTINYNTANGFTVLNKVGIGTATPGFKLDVRGTGTEEHINIQGSGTGSIKIGTVGGSGEFGAMWAATASPTVSNYAFLGNASFSIFNVPTGGSVRFRVNNADQMIIGSAGAVQLNAYGAGILTTDGSGNVTASPLPLTGTATLNFDLTAVNSQDLTITVTGAASGDPVSLALDPASVPADITYFGWVSSANTVTVRCSRVGGGAAVDPASGSFTARVFK